MTQHSPTDVLRWTLLGALGISVTFSCGGSAVTSGDGGSGDGDTAAGDGGAPTGDGDGTDGSGGGNGTGGPSEVVACTNPVDLGGGFFTCDEGYTHRSAAEECPSSVPRDFQIGDPTVCSLEEGCCQMDSDCTAANAFCQYWSGEGEGSSCMKGCVSDADCGNDEICQCGDPMGRCTTAECASDADCPGEARCASFATDDGCGPWTRFSCQTADDECASNADCAVGEECDGSGGVRQCVAQEFSCVIGRPFLVGETVRIAPISGRLDWLTEAQPNLQGLSRRERVELASAWEAAGQMEHASVAAFARFQLHLLSLGAPAELIERTNDALADETKHTKMCFGLASAYRGSKVGPGPLDVSDALGDGSWETILATTILEGCLGETAAALEAAEAAASCEDREVRAVLLTITEDETRHAELAWRFVRWALTVRPHMKEWIRSQFAHALSEVKQSELTPPALEYPSPLMRHGIFSRERRRAIRLEALSKIVAPCARQLFSSAPIIDEAGPEPARLPA